MATDMHYVHLKHIARASVEVCTDHFIFIPSALLSDDKKKKEEIRYVIRCSSLLAFILKYYYLQV